MVALLKFFLTRLLVAGLVLLTLGAAPAGIGGPFTLEDGDGRIVTDKDFGGRYLLVFFGDTNCPDVCPTALYKISQALALLGATPARLQAVFITVDPARDTPDVVSRYATLFSPDIMGLGGTADEVSQAAAAYHVSAGAPDSRIFLMGPDGRFLGVMPGDSGSAEMLAAKIQELMQ